MKLKPTASSKVQAIFKNLDLVDEHSEEIILEIATLCNIQPEDPLFPLLAKSIADRIAIEGTRQDLAKFAHNIEVHLTTIENQSGIKIQEIRDLTFDIKTAANRLSRQLVNAQSASTPIGVFLWALFGALVGNATLLLILHFFPQQ